MSAFLHRLARTAAACTLALAIPFAALAQPVAGAGSMHGGPGAGPMQPGPGHAGMHQAHKQRGYGHHEAHRGGDRETASMLRGLNLTEEQRDKVFAVLHAQAPQLRAQAKEMRNARRELRALTLAEGFDEARAKALADTLSRSIAETALIRTRSANEIYQALGPEQRRQVQQRMALREGARRARGESRSDRG